MAIGTKFFEKLKAAGIEPITVELNPRHTLYWFHNQLLPLTICPKCKKWWTTARTDMCVGCYIKALDRFENYSRKSKFIVR